MKSLKPRFFIALLPSQEIQKLAHEIKQYFVETYHSKAALRSPPHITLQPPFEWELAELPILSKQLQQFSNHQVSIPLILDGFAAFKPHVIYINVLKTPELLVIQQALMSHLEASLGIIHPASKHRSFTPHLTVAFRDLTKPNFYKAWTEFQDKKLYFEYKIDKLTLLVHHGKMWEVHQEFLFNS